MLTDGTTATKSHKLFIYCQIRAGTNASKRDSCQILNAFRIGVSLFDDLQGRQTETSSNRKTLDTLYV